MYKINYGIFFLVILFQINLKAKVTSQQEYIDSLISVATSLPNDSVKVVLLERIGYSYISLNPIEGKKYTTKALELARELGLTNREAASIALLAANCSANSEYDKALQHNLEAIEIFRSLNNQKGVAGVTTNLSQVYTKLGNYAKAIECNFEALKIYEETSEYRNKGIIYENIANIYYELKEFEKSKTYYLKALNLYKNHTVDADEARCLGNLARIYMEIPHYDTAMIYLNKAFNINQKNGNKTGALINLSNIGNVHSRKEEYAEALEYHYKALEIANNLGLKNFIATGKGNIGEVYLSQYKKSSPFNHNLIDNAQNYLTDAIAICDEIDFKAPKVDFLESLIEVYVIQKNYQKAYHLINKKIAINDSLYSLASKEQLSKLETQREIDLKDKDLLIKNKELEIISLNNQKKSLLYTFAIIVLIILLFVAFTYYRKKEKKHYEVISEIKQIQSHEVRGPIATILGLIKLLKDKNRSDESKLELIEGIEETTNKLNNIVNQIINNTKK
ncbi:MAG: tetratricopeptide repeat protein [Vicingaceae bacterium]|jgi:tetratricopeptide (TPR) repeat protein|nr:tetratricopeptide repeat protein [Flavobacteriales bacterium]MBQ19362.1 hypothetical protein [Flavobacteriales bacterium]MDF1675586.1 tetratricopeptide repeat protein [Vicingaceae bacterium]|tara:strand:- start:57685 stop:59202 length:1518 start_codon:yes stop_codon:yes gene_type:complete